MLFLPFSLVVPMWVRAWVWLWVCSKGVCHLDIKPDNMLLSSSVTPAAAVGARWFPTVKLADFGTRVGAYIAGAGGGELASL